MVEIRPMTAEQWQLHKTVRCKALAEAPYAYSTTWESVSQRSDADWIQVTARYATNPKNVTYFAFQGEQVCGMAGCGVDGSRAEMFALWVDPACRRAGVGRALIDFASAWSRAQGATQLQVGVFDDNLAALAYYRSAGFVDRGLTKPELSMAGRTVLLLLMDL